MVGSLLLMLTSCGSDEKEKPVQIILYPASQTVQIGRAIGISGNVVSNPKGMEFTMSVVPSTGSGCTQSGTTITCVPTEVNTYTITITAKADPSKMASATLIVTPAPIPPPPPDDPSITISFAGNDGSDEASVKLRNLIQFTAHPYLPEGQPQNQTPTWAVDAECRTNGIGDITRTGAFWAGDVAGECTVTASIKDINDKVFVAEVKVTVTETPVKISITPEERNTKAGVTVNFTGMVEPNPRGTEFAMTVIPATGSGCTQSVNNITCVPVEVNTYTITISATADPTKTAEAILTVEPADVEPEDPSITISFAGNDGSDEASVEAGETMQFTANYEIPSGQPTPQEPLWAVSAECATNGIGDIDQNGLFTALVAGECTVTASIKDINDANFPSNEVKVTVRPNPTWIESALIPDMKLRLVENGTFDMGCTAEQEDCLDREKPVRKVKLTRNYYIGKTEVTWAQWLAVMPEYAPVLGSNNRWNLNVSYYPMRDNRLGFDEMPGWLDNRPVTDISWEEIQIFITRLNALEPGRNYRLPTEAEWEYAARGGRSMKDDPECQTSVNRLCLYSGSNIAGNVAWYFDNSSETGVVISSGTVSTVRFMKEVATKYPNILGLHDMSGNVWELVNDFWSDSYDPSDVTNPKGPETGTNRVIRGGSIDGDIGGLRVANRLSVNSTSKNGNRGFRLATDR